VVQLLKKSVLKVLGPSLGVNQMWTKKNDHAPKIEFADMFLNTCPKRAFLKKIQVCLFSWALLVKCVKDVACKSSDNNFYT
jgi:hypothetical protein